MRCVVVLIAMVFASVSPAGPMVESWAFEGGGGAAAVAAAELSGWYATAETEGDTVEIRDVRQTLMRTITRVEIMSLAPWMSLDAGHDGPTALAWTDSGRALFIVVTDSAPAPDGLGSDVVLRFDTTLGTLTRFARAEIGTGSGGRLGAVHFRGVLSVATEYGAVLVYRAERNDLSGVLQFSWTLPGGETARGMAIARTLDAMFIVTESMLYRASSAGTAPVAVGPVTRGRGLAFSDHYGGPEHAGVFVIEGEGAGADARLLHVPIFQATGLIQYAPFVHVQSDADLKAVAATPCGRLLLASAIGTQVVRESADLRMDYESWLVDEFAQVVAFGGGLISPDGEPAGWVIDADVAVGGTRFHPATPDAAAWVVLLHIARDHIAGNQASGALARQILQRYAGQMPDGIGPSVSADGMLRHWINPATGGVKSGWNPEFATLSTMKIVLAADRARRFYAGDAQIVAAADVIIGRVENWDAYIEPGSDALYFVASPGGGPQAGSASAPFHEGIIFVEQAAKYGASEASYARWLDRSTLPSAVFVNGLPVTTGAQGVFQPAFVALYPWIVQRPFRQDATWKDSLRNLLASNGAWTDDHGPRFMTVFSAGTTHPSWGGYHADSLSDHPGDVTTFPSLMAFGALGETAASVGAYYAYRHGARQAFAGGASILFRWSNVLPGYRPADAGLPDVAIGGFGLAELIRPGTIDAVLAIPYRHECAADLVLPEGVVDFFDIAAFLAAFSAGDATADYAPSFGVLDFFDISVYLSHFSAGCP
jgi:hypothetical protein